MRLAVLSDIHSNIEALSACLEALKEKSVDGYVLCGDTVGYGPDPEAVIERVRALSPLYAVKGNHDLAALGEMDLGWFNAFARAAIEWTIGRLSGEAAAFLKGLPLRVETPDFTVVHGTPRDPAEEYLLTKQQFMENLGSFKASPCFVGHSHLPLYFQVLEGDRVVGDMLEGESRWRSGPLPCALNPGSVGQPRDLDPRAACAVFDTSDRTFYMLRVPYDVEATQKKIRAAGLPPFLAERLSQGR